MIADRAISAASVAGRDGFQQLVKAAKRKDRPFDCLLVDDTSRLARDLSDALRTWKILEYCEVTVVSVTQGIDSSQGNARPLIAMHGIMDEQYLTDLAKKVHRGQEGRALKATPLVADSTATITFRLRIRSVRANTDGLPFLVFHS